MSILNAKRSLAAGALAAIGASVCCVGPLVLLLLGISGAWASSLLAFEPYRPFFIGLAIVFLGLAFRKLYLAPQVCASDAACTDPLVLKRQRLIFWIVTGLMLCLLALPLAAPFFI